MLMDNYDLAEKEVIFTQIHEALWKNEMSAEDWEKQAQELVSHTFSFAKKEPQALTILLANDDEVKKLNLQFRNQNKPTNVLSFPNDDNTYAGDIALAYQIIKKEAQEQNKTFRDHAMHIMLHGILHLLGYDHQNENEADEMETLEKTILHYFKIKDPYL